MLQGSQGDSLARTCVTKLAAFLEDSDQNCAYIGKESLVIITDEKDSKVYCLTSVGQNRALAPTSRGRVSRDHSV